jgi:hypothetical protein
MAKTAICACGCGEAITHEGATYAGTTEAERNKHRARAAYKRKQGQAPVAGTAEALSALGLADEVTVSQLAATVASAAAELSRRVAGVDAAEVARQIEAGLAEARGQVEAAEARAAKAEAGMVSAAEELTAAVRRADQADDDAFHSGQEVAEVKNAFAELEATQKEVWNLHLQSTKDCAEAERKADRAEAALAELRTGFDRAVAEARKSIESEVAVRLADQRTEHERALSALREEIVRLTAGSSSTSTRRTRKPDAKPMAEAQPVVKAGTSKVTAVKASS